MQIQEMESQIFLERLRSEHQNLLFRHNLKKSTLFSHLKTLMAQTDKEELNHFYRNISMNYDERPPQINMDQTKTPSQAIQDLQEANRQIQASNSHIKEDIMTMKGTFHIYK